MQYNLLGRGELHWFTLRFQQQSKEEGYLWACRPQLISGIATCALLSIVSALSFFCIDVIRSHDEVFCMGSPVNCGLAIYKLVGAAITFVGFLNLRRLTDCMPGVWLEVFSMCGILGMQFAVVLFEPWYFTKVLQLLPDSSFADLHADTHISESDARILLLAAALNSTACLFLTIRSSVMWIACTTCAASYGIAALALGSPEGENYAFINMCFLGVVSFITFIGHRSNEKQKRMWFSRHLQEKCKRFQAEHEISEIRRRDMEPNDCARSEGAFDIDSDADDLRQRKIAEISNIGLSEHWLINAELLTFRSDFELLGSGGFGFVLSAQYHGSSVAVKFPKPSIVGPTVRSLPELASELRIMRRVRHPNIVLFYGACIVPSSGELALVLERLHGSRLDMFVRSPCTAEVAHSRLAILLHISGAVRYLHSSIPSILHGDLKGSNVLVEGGVHAPLAKLIDFGLSKVLSGGVKPFSSGSIAWIAPEIAMKHMPSVASDVFAYGRIMHLVMTGTVPLQNWTKAKLLAGLRRGNIPALNWPSNLVYGLECRAISEKCCSPLVADRPSSSEIHVMLQELSGTHCPADCALLSWESTIDIVRVDLKKKIVPAEQARKKPPTNWLPVIPECVGKADNASSEVVFPGLLETHRFVQLATLLALLRQWNFSLPSGPCCTFHASLSNLENLMDILKSRPCDPSFIPAACLQCKGCSLMDCHEDGICRHCGHGGQSQSFTSTSFAFVEL